MILSVDWRPVRRRRDDGSWIGPRGASTARWWSA